MMNNDTEGDNWGQLLSDFGIEDSTPPEVQTAEPPGSPERAKALSQPTGSSNIDSGRDELENGIVSESSNTKDKKSIFSRFPKVNFFGTPPESSLDSVIEGVKSPSLGGKTFTDNKLEKMPLSEEWSDQQERNAAVDPDALSAVASQIGTLASGRGTRTPRGEKQEEHRGKRNVSSMFDDPVPESDEVRALKDIMGPPPSRSEARRDSSFDDEADTWQRGRGRQKSPPMEKEVRERGPRYRQPVEVDDLPETDFEPIDDDMPKQRGRGRRGSRYTGGGPRGPERFQDDVPQEEWSEVDAALQARRSEPPQRGGRRQSYDKRRGQERTERHTFDRESLERERDVEESEIAVAHGNVPSWDEAIGGIIAGNIARHKNYAGRGRR